MYRLIIMNIEGKDKQKMKARYGFLPVTIPQYCAYFSNKMKAVRINAARKTKDVENGDPG